MYSLAESIEVEEVSFEKETKKRSSLESPMEDERVKNPCLLSDQRSIKSLNLHELVDKVLFFTFTSNELRAKTSWLTINVNS